MTSRRTSWLIAWLAAVSLSGIAAAQDTISGQAIADTDITGKTVHDSIINGGNVRESDLYGVRLRALTLDDSRIENAAVSNSTIRSSTVQRASLYQVTIEGSDIQGAWLERAKMTGGSLSDASVRETRLSDVRLCRVLFVATGLVDTSGCSQGETTPTTPATPTTTPTPPAMPPMSGLTLSNGGDTAPGFTSDSNLYRGKLFPNARPGVVTEICIVGNWGGTSVLAVKARPDASAPQFTESITLARLNEWNCKDVDQRFVGDSLFIYKLSGDGVIAYDSGSPADSWYSNDGGATWQQDGLRRAIRVTLDG